MSTFFRHPGQHGRKQVLTLILLHRRGIHQARGNIHFTASTLFGRGIIKNGKGPDTIPENGSNELKDIDASGFYVVQARCKC